jgi:hypothetical protein
MYDIIGCKKVIESIIIQAGRDAANDDYITRNDAKDWLVSKEAADMAASVDIDINIIVSRLKKVARC